jgi:hypothetical protein
MNKQLILQACTVNGMYVSLPPQQLERKLYQEVAQALQLIGGKWKGGKTQAFEFKEDPTELLAEIASGEKRNLKKEFQFFATPPDIAAKMAAELWLYPKGEPYTIGEPNGGQGALIMAVWAEMGKEVPVYTYEPMPTNLIFLKRLSAVKILGPDFLDCHFKFDRIIANPPFTNNQDIDHIMHMYECLNPNGRMVTLASTSWETGSQKKQVEFREWLSAKDASIEKIDKGAFKESGTNIETRMIIINKHN